MSVVPVTYSLIDRNYLSLQVKERYNLPIKNLWLFRRTLNDVYFIESGVNKYRLIVYRTWRSKDDVGFEVSWIKYLNLKSAPAMLIKEQSNGALFSSISAPEGLRCFALFPYLENVHHMPLNTETAKICGESLANIHLLSNDFKTDYRRFVLESDHLINQPMKGIESWFGKFNLGSEIKTLKSVASHTTKKINLLDKVSGFYGPCHGDTHFGNLMFTTTREPVWFDFDCGGLGWRIYDIASFYWALKIKWMGWNIRYEGSDEEIWNYFIEGYISKRSLSALEYEILPYFIFARGIWALGLHPNNIDDWSSESSEDGGEFLMKHLELFENVCKDYQITNILT